LKEYPHYYRVSASAESDGDVSHTSPGLDSFVSAPPAEFDGPGDLWSPETLLVAAVAGCFVLSFRGVAKASRFEWLSLDCDVESMLTRIDRTTKFTEFAIRATLFVPPDTNEERAQRLLEKAEATCLITNSLSASIHLSATVSTKP
jgi:organic hydroperoxide reductase OsmC/OhrA